MTDCVAYTRKGVGGVVRHDGETRGRGTEMDIDAAVAELNRIAARNVNRGFAVSDHDATRMVELWDAINGWLSRGNHLPDVWSRDAVVRAVANSV